LVLFLLALLIIPILTQRPPTSPTMPLDPMSSFFALFGAKITELLTQAVWITALTTFLLIIWLRYKRGKHPAARIDWYEFAGGVAIAVFFELSASRFILKEQLTFTDLLTTISLEIIPDLIFAYLWNARLLKESQANLELSRNLQRQAIDWSRRLSQYRLIRPLLNQFERYMDRRGHRQMNQ
jgi:hypothetical protein